MQETQVQSLGWEDPLEKGNGYPPQHFCLENPMDRGAWRAMVHGVAKSWMWLRDQHTQLWERWHQPMTAPPWVTLKASSAAAADGNEGGRKEEGRNSETDASPVPAPRCREGAGSGSRNTAQLYLQTQGSITQLWWLLPFLLFLLFPSSPSFSPLPAFSVPFLPSFSFSSPPLHSPCPKRERALK